MSRHPLLGKRVGKFRLRELIAEGGMGAVFVSEHAETGARYAVKVLHDVFARDDELRERFRKEARATRDLAHPGVVAIHDSGETPEGTSYLVMELLRGESLAARLRRGPLDEETARAVAAAVADCVAAAHARGVIHRDLKPDNVYLALPEGALAPCVRVDGKEQQVKVLDFGLAKLVAGTRLTATSSMFGTPAYMAPEQGRSSRGVDARADVYALGVMLYEMITGRVPFEGADMVEILLRASTEAPEPPSRFAAITPALEALILECLEKDPARRPGGMISVRDRLGGVRAAARVAGGVATVVPGAVGQPKPPAHVAAAPPTPPVARSLPSPRRTASWRRRAGVVAAALAALVTLGVALAPSRVAMSPHEFASDLPLDRAADRPREIVPAPPPEARPALSIEPRPTLPAVAAPPVIAPAEPAPAEPARKPTGSQYLTGPITSTVLENDGTCYALAFNRSEELLAAGYAGGAIRLWSTSTRRLVDEIPPKPSYGGRVRFVAFDRTESRILSVDDYHLRVFDAHTRGVLDEIYDHGWFAALSPDGRTLGIDEALFDADTLKPRRKVPSDRRDAFGGNYNMVHAVAFSPDGRYYAVGAWDHVTRISDVATGRVVRRLAGHTEGVAAVAFDPDGYTVATGSHDGTVRIWSMRDGRTMRVLRGHDQPVWSLAFNPDGESLASGDDAGVIKIWKYPDGELVATLHDHTDDVNALLYHSNGRLLVSASDDHTIRWWHLE